MRMDRRLPTPIWLPLLMAAALPVHAQQDKGFQFLAGYQLQHDNNLFRLPPGVDPRLAIGKPSAADTLQIKSLGVRFDQSYSLQNIQAEASVVDYSYSRNSRYDLVATNYDASWDWAVTPDLRGRVHADRSETVNSFDDTSAQTTGTNRRVRTHEGVDFRYLLDGAWSVLGGLYRSEDRYDESVVGADNYRQTSAEGGMRRVFGTGSDVTARGRYSNGKSLDAQGSSNDFRQLDAQVDVRWALSSLTAVNAGIKYLDRNYSSSSAYDYNGFNTSASVQWQPTGKLMLNAGASSELGSYRTSASTHSRTDRLNVSATWQHSPFTSVRASIGETRLRLLGHPSGGTTSPRRDNTLETALSANWIIDDLFTLSGGITHRKRDSTVSLNDFSSTQVNVGLNARF